MHSRQEMKSSLLKFDSLGLNTFRYICNPVCTESDFFSNLKASLVSHLLMSIMKTFYISLFRIFPPGDPTLRFYHQWYLSARKNQYVFIEKHMCFTEEFEAFQAPQSVSSRCRFVAFWGLCNDITALSIKRWMNSFYSAALIYDIYKHNV